MADVTNDFIFNFYYAGKTQLDIFLSCHISLFCHHSIVYDQDKLGHYYPVARGAYRKPPVTQRLLTKRAFYLFKVNIFKKITTSVLEKPRKCLKNVYINPTVLPDLSIWQTNHVYCMWVPRHKSDVQTIRNVETAKQLHTLKSFQPKDLFWSLLDPLQPNKNILHTVF